MATYTHYDDEGNVIGKHTADRMRIEMGMVQLLDASDEPVAVILLLAGQSVSRDKGVSE